MKKLSRKEIEYLIMQELSAMGEDVLKPFPQGKEKIHTPPLGSSSHGYKSKHALCKKCDIPHDICECGSMYESDCSECGTMMNESSCGCTGSEKSYPSSSSYPVGNIDYHKVMLSTLNSYHDKMHLSHDHKRGGAYMSKSQLYKVEEYARKLYNIIPEGHDLEDWMRTKISQIADDISEVYHALNHDKFQGDI